MSGAPTLGIETYFDLVCPWCFIGKRQLAMARERFAAQSPGIVVETTWRPVQLLPDVPAEGIPFADFYLRRLGSPEAVRARQQQVIEAARRVGLTLDLAAIRRMPNTARAHRLLGRVATLGRPALYEALLDRLFAAYFQRGEDIGDPATLRGVAEEIGVPASSIDDATDAPLSARTAVTGVPFFVFDGRLSVSGAQDAAVLLDAMHRALGATAKAPA